MNNYLRLLNTSQQYILMSIGNEATPMPPCVRTSDIINAQRSLMKMGYIIAHKGSRLIPGTDDEFVTEFSLTEKGREVLLGLAREKGII